MRVFQECINCGYFHEEAVIIDCNNPQTRLDIQHLPVEDDVEVMYLTKEQGGRFYMNEKPQMRAFTIAATMPDGSTHRMTVWTSTTDLATQSAVENFPTAREIYIDNELAVGTN